MKYLKHKEYGFVPVVEIGITEVLWDDNQFDRMTPPNRVYNSSPIEEFDLDLEFEAPSLDQEFSTRLAEHEILLSFHKDTDAEMFQNFWQQEGLNLFAKFVQKNQPDMPF